MGANIAVNMGAERAPACARAPCSTRCSNLMLQSTQQKMDRLQSRQQTRTASSVLSEAQALQWTGQRVMPASAALCSTHRSDVAVNTEDISMFHPSIGANTAIDTWAMLAPAALFSIRCSCMLQSTRQNKEIVPLFLQGDVCIAVGTTERGCAGGARIACVLHHCTAMQW